MIFKVIAHYIKILEFRNDRKMEFILRDVEELKFLLM